MTEPQWRYHTPERDGHAPDDWDGVNVECICRNNQRVDVSACPVWFEGQEYRYRPRPLQDATVEPSFDTVSRQDAVKAVEAIEVPEGGFDDTLDAWLKAIRIAAKAVRDIPKIGDPLQATKDAEQAVLADIAEMMSSHVENWPEPKRIETALKLIDKTIRAAFEEGKKAGFTLNASRDGLIKHMTNRFLGWKLPEDFNPDNGISFKPTFNDHWEQPMRCNPMGTNLFNAVQAEEMVRYMLAGFGQSDMVKEGLVERLSDEADLCRNEGANDIAGLLDEARQALSTEPSFDTLKDQCLRLPQDQREALIEAMQKPQRDWAMEVAAGCWLNEDLTQIVAARVRSMCRPKEDDCATEQLRAAYGDDWRRTLHNAVNNKERQS